MKKLYLTILIALLCTIGISVRANEPCASAVFYDKGVNAENLTAVNGNDIRYKNSEREGIMGWYLDTYESNHCINFVVNNASAENYGANYRLDVTYYDEKSGYFTLIYNTSRGKRTLEHISLTGSNEWKTHSFYMYDAYFSHSIFGANDFRLTVYDSDYAYSDFGVLISKVELYRLGTVTATAAEMTTSGNNTIFFGEEEVSLDFVINNKENDFSGILEYEITDDNGKIISSGNQSISLSSGENNLTLKPAIDAYGVFNLRLKIINSQKAYESIDEFSFSRINTDYGKTVNEDFGVTAHIGYPTRSYDTDLHTTLMKNSGMRFVRDEIHWEDYEKEKGVYKLLPNHSEELVQLKAKGLEPLFVLGFSNPIYIERYGSETDDFPLYEAELEAFYNYVYKLVSETKGYIKYFEVWNEYNHNNSDMTTEEYVNILKTAYAAAKAANPDCKIVGMVFCSTRTIEEMKKAVALGAMDYMDIVSTHYYTINEASQNPERSYLNIELAELKELCGDKELWLSEIGWATNHNGLADREGAAYASRFLMWNESKGYVDKVLWYDWHDDGNIPNYFEHNFGMLKNDYSSKRVYAAISNYNKLIAPTVHTKTSIHGSTYMHTFRKNDGNSIYAIYNCDKAKSNKTIYTKADKVTVYDLYGTTEEITVLNGRFVLEISGEPLYIEPSGNDIYLADELAKVSFNGEEKEQYGIEVSGSFPWTASEINADIISVGDFDAYENFEVDVTYADGDDGFFTICYDSADGEKCAEPVCLSGTGQLKTHTFLLQNARFSNGVDSLYDFKLTLCNEEGEYSEYDTEITEITVRECDSISAVRISADDTAFCTNEPQNISINLKNVLGFNIEPMIKYTVIGKNGKTYKEYEKKITLSAYEEADFVLKTAIDVYGAFVLEIEVIDEENNIYAADSINLTVVNTAFGKYILKTAAISSDITDTTYIKESGVKTVYTRLLWNDYEKEKGVYAPPNEFYNSLKLLSSEGYKIIVETDFYNNLYASDDKEAFYNFISALAREVSGYCGVIALKCADGMANEEYLKITEYAKNALSSASDGIMLAAGETADEYADIIISDCFISSAKPMLITYGGNDDIIKMLLKCKTENPDSSVIFNCSNYVQYAKIASMSKVLENAQIQSFNENEGIYLFEFKKSDGSKVYAVYSDADGSDLTLSTGCESIIIYDEYGNKSEKASDNGEYNITVGTEILYITASKEKIWIDYSTDTVWLKDFTDSGAEGENVNITVYNEAAKKNNDFGITYVNQQKTAENGSFEFAFDISCGEGLYRAVVTDGHNMYREYNIEINRIVNAEILFTDESGNVITKFQDIMDSESEKFYISADMDNSNNAKNECMLIVCGYSENVLTFCRIENGSLTGSFSKHLSLELPSGEANKADIIKVFLWDENSLSNLTKAVYLN